MKTGKVLVLITIMALSVSLITTGQANAFSFTAPLFTYTPPNTSTDCPDYDGDGTCDMVSMETLSAASTTLGGWDTDLIFRFYQGQLSLMPTVTNTSTTATYAYSALVITDDEIEQLYNDLVCADAEIPDEFTVGTDGTVTFTADNYTVTFTPETCAPVPEPSTLALMGIGLAGLLGFKVKKRKSA